MQQLDMAFIKILQNSLDIHQQANQNPVDTDLLHRDIALKIVI